MAERIEADYEKLGEISTRFTQQEDLFQQIQQNLSGRRDALENEWIGRGYDAFAGEMDDLILPVVQRVVQAMQEASIITRQIADTLRAAEEEAANSFEVLA